MKLTIEQLNLLREAVLAYAYHPDNRKAKGKCFIVEQEILNEIETLRPSDN